MIEALKLITSNYIIDVALTAWASAQILKTLFTLIFQKKLVLERLVGAGGMPSAHTALVVSLTVAMARKEGFASPMFALALCFAVVVMYDAMGVRRAAGEQAKVLNTVILSLFQKRHLFGDFPRLEDFLKRKKKSSKEQPKETELTEVEIENDPYYKMLNEFLGHTPMEVIGGALLGIFVALVFPVF